MQGQHVRSAEQLVQFHKFHRERYGSGRGRKFGGGFAGGSGDHLHAERVRQFGDAAPDGPETEDAHDLARKLHLRRIPETPVRPGGPAPGTDARVVQGRAAAQFQQQRESMLRHGLRAVVYHVHHRDAPSARRRDVHHVVPRGDDPDAAQARQGRQRVLIQTGLVGDQDLRPPTPLQHIFGIGAVIHRQIAERRQRIPRIVAGIQGIAVKNNDFHGTAPVDVRLMFKGTKKIPDTFAL